MLDSIPNVPVGQWVEAIVSFIQNNFAPVLDGITHIVNFTLSNLEFGLKETPVLVLALLLSGLAWWLAGRNVGLFTFFGLLLVHNFGLWTSAMETLAMVVVSTTIALFIGIPLGIWASQNNIVNSFIRPMLDLMQTMPPFVYLIPAVFFFDIGRVPGVMATVIFSMPPAIRLTNLGIRQVPEELIEAANAFGSTVKQKLLKVQLPSAMPTIMAGVNQCIMLALSMVVIAAMIGGAGLGREVMRGINRLNIGLGAEAGLAVVIIAIMLDRITESLGQSSKK